MKICAIGNSHLAALIVAWKELEPEYPGTQFTFFAAPGSMMDDLAVEDRSLVPTTEELRRFLEQTTPDVSIFSDFDHYIVCGLQFKILRAGDLCRNFRAETHRRDERAPISDECFVRCLQDRLLDTAAVRTILKLRQVTSSPITLLPQPLPPQGFVPYKWLRQAEQNREDESIAELFEAACRRIANDLGVRVIFQPESTRAGPLRTSPGFSNGSKRLRGGFTSSHPDGDQHMNADFGGLMIRHALAQLAHETTSVAKSERPRDELCGADCVAGP